MRISWFKEVCDFIDFKAVGLYIEDHLRFIVVFVGGFVTLFQAIAMLARAGNDDGVHSDYFGEPGEFSEESQCRPDPIYVRPINVKTGFRAFVSKYNKIVFNLRLCYKTKSVLYFEAISEAKQ